MELADFRVLVTPVSESDKAVLFAVEDIGDVWVPKSVIGYDSEVWRGADETGYLEVKHWWARKQGWV